MVDATDSQTLIESFDSKMSTHISAIIAISFGAFTLLTFLNGKSSQLLDPAVLYIFILDAFVFPLAIIYCFSRSAHYSYCAELVKRKTDLRKISDEVSDKALKDMTYPLNKIVKFRHIIGIRKIVIFVIPLIYICWFGVIFAVMNLPLPTL
jgi:hypothetical protein